jgi:hypothetical protein
MRLHLLGLPLDAVDLPGALLPPVPPAVTLDPPEVKALPVVAVVLLVKGGTPDAAATPGGRGCPYLRLLSARVLQSVRTERGATLEWTRRATPHDLCVAHVFEK